MSRVQRVGVFNFGTDRVQVLEKTSGLGIGTAFLSIGYYRVLKILIGYFSITSLIRFFSFGSTKVLATLGRWTQVHVQIQKGFNAILGYCSSRALEILTNKSKGPLKNQIEYLIF